MTSDRQRQRFVQIISGVLLVFFVALLTYFGLSYFRTSGVLQSVAVANTIGDVGIEAEDVITQVQEIGQDKLLGVVISTAGVLATLWGACSPFLLTIWADRGGMRKLQRQRQEYEIEKLKAEIQKLAVEAEVLKNPL